VGYLTGHKLDVVEIADWAYSKGYFTGGAGTYRDPFYAKASIRYGEKYNFTIDTGDGGGYWSTIYNSKVKNHLIGGGAVIIHVYNHFMALVGYDESSGLYHLYDCAPRDRRGTNYNGGDVWFTAAQLSSGYTDVDWFCLVSSTLPSETWIERACFDPMIYRDRYDDLAGLTEAQLKEHWLNSGIAEGRSASAILDLDYYYRNNADLQQAYGKDFVALYNHFINKGYKEGRKSSLMFDGSFYSNQYSDVGDIANCLKHYVDIGMKDGRRGSLTFDPDYYWHIRPDVAAAWPAHYEMCAKHYAGHGIKAGIVAYDNQSPTISNINITNITPNGYTVSCEVTDNWEVSKVAFPTWTVSNEQDDLIDDWSNTQLGTASGNVYTFQVLSSHHGNEEGEYLTHIYAYDTRGNVSTVHLNTVILNKQSHLMLFNSSNYKREGEYIKNISSSTDVKTLLSHFDNYNLQVVNKSGDILESEDIVGTGSTIKLVINNAPVDSATVVVYGDVDGSGIVDTIDYMRIKAAMIGKFTLTNTEFEAADLDRNECIDATDYIRVKSYLLGNYQI
jgi:hypothetical protein